MSATETLPQDNGNAWEVLREAAIVHQVVKAASLLAFFRVIFFILLRGCASVRKAVFVVSFGKGSPRRGKPKIQAFLKVDRGACGASGCVTG